MTGALEALRQDTVKLLREHGVQAVAAMEPDRAMRWREPVVAVSLSRVSCAAGGFKDYLGLRTDEKTGKVYELYGREAELTVALDVYAPKTGGESACRRTMDAVAETVLLRGIGGLTVQELESDKASYSEQERMYRLPARCRCKAWLVASAAEDGVFTDFEVKGRKA